MTFNASMRSSLVGLYPASKLQTNRMMTSETRRVVSVANDASKLVEERNRPGRIGNLGWSSVAPQPCYACSWYSIPSCPPDSRSASRFGFLSFCVPKYSSHHETKTTCHPCPPSRIACRSPGFRHLRSPNALPLRLHPTLSRTCPGLQRNPPLLGDPELQRLERQGVAVVPSVPWPASKKIIEPQAVFR
jgi:hypothetical protein